MIVDFIRALFCDSTTALSEFMYFQLFNRYVVTQSGIGTPIIVSNNHHMVTTIKYLIQNPELDRCS